MPIGSMKLAQMDLHKAQLQHGCPGRGREGGGWVEITGKCWDAGWRGEKAELRNYRGRGSDKMIMGAF